MDSAGEFFCERISVNTETTDNIGNEGFVGWVGYDRDCGFCCNFVRRWQGLFEKRGFTFVPLQNHWLAGRLGAVGRASAPGQSAGLAKADAAEEDQLAGRGRPAYDDMPGDMPGEMKLLMADGRVLGGAAAIAAMARAVWYFAPAGWFMALPGIRFLVDRAYKWVAQNRHQLGVCKVPERIAAHNQHGHAAFFEMP